jgi:hypothetical protein
MGLEPQSCWHVDLEAHRGGWELSSLEQWDEKYSIWNGGHEPPLIISAGGCKIFGQW